jgi:hypothetical protein
VQGGAPKNPREVATAILNALPETTAIDGTPTLAGPGFINIKLSSAFLSNRLQTMITQVTRSCVSKIISLQLLQTPYVQMSPLHPSFWEFNYDQWIVVYLGQGCWHVGAITALQARSSGLFIPQRGQGDACGPPALHNYWRHHRAHTGVLWGGHAANQPRGASQGRSA